LLPYDYRGARVVHAKLRSGGLGLEGAVGAERAPSPFFGSLRAPLLRRRTPRNPNRHAQRVASVSEPQRGGCAARAEKESVVPAPSFASFFVFGDSPAPPVSIEEFAQDPPAPPVESASPVLLADFPDPWRIVAQTPKSLGWWPLFKLLDSKLSIV
jgi:hypothetical protein